MAETIQTVGPLAGICGHDGTNWEKILIDATKRLVVAVAAFSDVLEVIQDTPGDLLMGAHSFDGATWRKDNLKWGYHDRYIEFVQELGVGAGTQTKYGTAVPAGEVWVVTRLSAYCSTNNPTYASVGIDDGTSARIMLLEPYPVALTTVGLTGQFVLKEGDRAFYRFTACVAGDNIYGFFGGYKMDISM